MMKKRGAKKYARSFADITTSQAWHNIYDFSDRDTICNAFDILASLIRICHEQQQMVEVLEAEIDVLRHEFES